MFFVSNRGRNCVESADFDFHPRLVFVTKRGDILLCFSLDEMLLLCVHPFCLCRACDLETNRIELKVLESVNKESKLNPNVIHFFTR